MAIGRLPPNVRIAGPDGLPTMEFLRLWNSLIERVGGGAQNPPSTPTGLGYSIGAGGVTLFCDENPASESIVGYQWRLGVAFAGGTVLSPIGSNSITVPSDQVGVYTVWVAAADVRGNFSTAVSMSVTVTDADLGLFSPEVTLVADGKDFNNGAPANITLTALLLNLPSPTYVWKVDGVIDGAAVTGTYVVAAYHGSPKTIRCEVTSGVSGLTAADEFIIQSIDGDLTETILTASGTSIVMNNANLFKSNSGLGGVFIGSGGLFGKDSGGTTTFSIAATTGAATFKGDINGGANIDITGRASFGGAYTAGGSTVAMDINLGGASGNGLLVKTTTNGGFAITGSASGTDGTGLWGISSSGLGVFGTAGNGGVGVQASNTGSGYAFSSQGKARLDNSTFTWNGYTYAAPAGSTTTTLHNDGVWRDPVTTARVNAAFGVASGAVVQGIGPDTGAIVLPSAGGISILCTVAGVQTSGSGTVLTIQNVSDRRLKEDIEDEAWGLDFVLKQRVVSYRMRGKPTLHHGWIYQEVQKHVEDENDSLAMLNANGFGGVDATGMTAVLMKAVQQLHAQVQQLKAKHQ